MFLNCREAVWAHPSANFGKERVWGEDFLFRNL